MIGVEALLGTRLSRESPHSCCSIRAWFGLFVQLVFYLVGQFLDDSLELTDRLLCGSLLDVSFVRVVDAL